MDDLEDLFWTFVQFVIGVILLIIIACIGMAVVAGSIHLYHGLLIPALGMMVGGA